MRSRLDSVELEIRDETYGWRLEKYARSPRWMFWRSWRLVSVTRPYLPFEQDVPNVQNISW